MMSMYEYRFLVWKENLRRKIFQVAYKIKDFLEDENAVGVIEVVLILVVLIGLVAIFKTQINDLLTRIFSSINSLSDDIL